jgi:hypothetical protein
MSPRGFVAARTFVVVLFTLFLLTTPAFAAPRSEDFDFARMASIWSRLVERVTSIWAADLLPPGGGGGTSGGGGGSGTSIDPSGIRHPVG